MILFVPGYDEATRANQLIADQLLAPGEAAFFGEEATRERLHEALRSTSSALWVMSHGERDRLKCREGTALAGEDASAVGARSVFAFACHTGTMLGEKMAESGAVWWGYTGAIQSPPTDDLSSLFVLLFAFVRGSFWRLETTQERAECADLLRELCLLAEEHVDEAHARDASLATMDAYLCLLNLWDRLRIWEPGASAPLQHPEAKPPLFL